MASGPTIVSTPFPSDCSTVLLDEDVSHTAVLTEESVSSVERFFKTWCSCVDPGPIVTLTKDVIAFGVSSMT